MVSSVRLILGLVSRGRIPPATCNGSVHKGKLERRRRSFEFAVGLDLVLDPYPERLACLPVGQAEWVHERMARFRAEADANGIDAPLEAACFLTMADEIIVRYGLWDSAGLIGTVAAWAEFMGQRPLWMFIADELRALWTLHESTVRSDLAGWGDAAAAVPLGRRVGIHGGHDIGYADLIVGTLLVEIRTGHMSDWDLGQAYDQLRSYGGSLDPPAYR